MLVKVEGMLPRGCTTKGIVLAITGKIGTAGGTNYAMEFGGSAIRALLMEGCMTVCNMAIEVNARAGMVAVDDVTLEYIEGHPSVPRGVEWEQAVAYWCTLYSGRGTHFDQVVELRAEEIHPQVSWGTSPEIVASVKDHVPDPDKEKDSNKHSAMERALEHVGLQPNVAISDINIGKAFIDSCTSSHIEGMRAVVWVVQRLGKHVAPNVKLAMVTPGSGLVEEQTECEGLDKIFKSVGSERREPGYSVCFAMSADCLEPGEHCASTSNHNFEGRQGVSGRVHLVNPVMAATAVLEGHFVDVRKLA